MDIFIFLEIQEITKCTRRILSINWKMCKYKMMSFECLSVDTYILPYFQLHSMSQREVKMSAPDGGPVSRKLDIIDIGISILA